MSIPAQGAVGAETMTAGQPVIRKAVFEIASRRIKSGAPGLAPATAEAIARIIGLEAAKALASPRAGSDERTAGGWRKVMRDLIAEHDKHVCLHEETHRGGAIWTICDHCGRKWADDEGGFQPYEEPAAVTAAWALLKCEDATPAQPAGAVPDSLRALSEAIQITDECLPGIYQYPVHGEWLIGWLFTEPNRKKGAQHVADLARLGLAVRDIVRASPSGPEPFPEGGTAAMRNSAAVANAISTHSAEQSAGSGAETVWTHPHLPNVAKAVVAEAEAINAALASHPAGQSAGSGAEADVAALAEAASVPERAYGILWRLTAFDTGQIGYAHDARKVLLAAMDKDGQRRGIAWATRQYGPLGPSPRFMLNDEDRMEMGL